MGLFKIVFPQGIYLGVGLLGHMVALCLIFKGISIPSSIMAVSVYVTRRSWHPVPSLHGKRWGTMETVTDFILGGSKITEDGDCSHKIKRCLLLERKAMTNIGSILKSRDLTLPTKVHLVQAMVFPAVM